MSFLSRFIGSGRKNKGAGNNGDEDSVDAANRTEGMDAAVFSQPIGYIPQFPAPPKYIRVRQLPKQAVRIRVDTDTCLGPVTPQVAERLQQSVPSPRAI